MSRLWFCSEACREAADSTPRPWPFAVHNDRCVMCHAPRPDVDAFLIAKADMSTGYYGFTAEPLIIVGDYVIVRVDAAWKHAAWEHIASGLQLGAAAIYDTAIEALSEAAELMRRYGARQGGPRWAAFEARAQGIGHRLALAYTISDSETITYTLRVFDGPHPGERSSGCVGLTAFRELRAAVGHAFPGRFRAALAHAWVSLGLA